MIQKACKVVSNCIWRNSAPSQHRTPKQILQTKISKSWLVDNARTGTRWKQQNVPGVVETHVKIVPWKHTSNFQKGVTDFLRILRTGGKKQQNCFFKSLKFPLNFTCAFKSTPHQKHRFPLSRMITKSLWRKTGWYEVISAFGMSAQLAMATSQVWDGEKPSQTQVWDDVCLRWFALEICAEICDFCAGSLRWDMWILRWKFALRYVFFALEVCAEICFFLRWTNLGWLDFALKSLRWRLRWVLRWAFGMAKKSLRWWFGMEKTRVWYDVLRWSWEVKVLFGCFTSKNYSGCFCNIWLFFFHYRNAIPFEDWWKHHRVWL